MGKVHTFPSGVDARLRQVRRMLEALPSSIGFALLVVHDDHTDAAQVFTNVEASDLAEVFDAWIVRVTGVREYCLTSEEAKELVELALAFRTMRLDVFRRLTPATKELGESLECGYALAQKVLEVVGDDVDDVAEPVS